MTETPAPKKRQRVCYVVAQHEDGRVTRIFHPKPTRFIEGSQMHRMMAKDLGRDTFDGWTIGIQVGPPTPVYTSDAAWVEDRQDQLRYEKDVAQRGICWAVLGDLAVADAQARKLDGPTLIHNSVELDYWDGDWRHGKSWVEAYQ